MFNDYILMHIKESAELKKNILSDKKIIDQISQVADLLVSTYQNQAKILLGGNGGSAADAQHIAGELVSKFYYDRPALPAIALTVDTSIITAIGNDYGYDYLFKRQLEALCHKNDVFIGLTTSGNSKNIIEALKYCKEHNIKSVCFNGKDGGIIESENLADINIIVPHNDTPRIQEVHILIGHILCAIVEKEIFPCKR